MTAISTDESTIVPSSAAAHHAYLLFETLQYHVPSSIVTLVMMRRASASGCLFVSALVDVFKAKNTFKLLNVRKTW